MIIISCDAHDRNHLNMIMIFLLLLLLRHFIPCSYILLILAGAFYRVIFGYPKLHGKFHGKYFITVSRRDLGRFHPNCGQ